MEQDSQLRAASIWEPLYAAGRHDNHWPWDAVVTFLAQAEQFLGTNELRVLEVGCGTGSNLLAAKGRGHSVAGIDVSKTAIATARERLGISSETDLHVGDFTLLPWLDSSFDIVIDRGALYCATPDQLRDAVVEITRVLERGGLFYFNPYSTTHSDSALASDQGDLRHLEQADSGMFQGLGGGTFVSPRGARSLLNDRYWTILSMREINSVELCEPGGFYPHGECTAELRIVATRR